METIIHKADNRGHFNHGWLNTWHSFSFANYYNPEKVHFGALRVLNDDIIYPSEGFGRHPHDNMEIITIPLSGMLLHRDSMGHEQTIQAGEVQVMSAGTGIFHEEYNASKTEPVSLLQIWIYPNKLNIKPVYNQKGFNSTNAMNQWQYLVTHDVKDTLHIQQNASISRCFMTKNFRLDYSINEASYGSYLFVVYGKISIDGKTLGSRDAIGVSDVKNLQIEALTDSYIINIEVPDINSNN